MVEFWYLHHFQQYFSYIVAVSFKGGENRSTRRKTTDMPQVTVSSDKEKKGVN
jgi:hypothetical protein